MVARKKKSGSRKSAAKKAPKMRKARVAPKAKKKAATAPKRKVAAKKAVRARSKPVAAKKKPVAAPKAAVVRPAPAPAPEPAPPPAPAPVPAAVAELDDRIAIVRANLRELVEQAASSAGAANEELLSQRIAEQEERLRRLRQERDALDC